MKQIGFISFIIVLYVALPLFVSANHQGKFHLVPECGQDVPLTVPGIAPEDVQTGTQLISCNTCHLFELALNVLNFIWNPIAVVAAALMFTYGGIMMIVPSFGGSVAMYERGKKILANALIGLLIVFAAWLIIDTIIKVIVGNPQFGVLSQQPGQIPKIEGYGPWNSFTCTSVAPIVTTIVPPPLPDKPPVAPGPHLDDAVARSQLVGAGIKVVSTGSCSSQTNPSCTSLQGMPAVGVDELLRMNTALKAECPSCVLVVTGGTEVGHDAHGPGKAVVDISSRDPAVNDFIKQTIGVQSPQINTWYKGGDNHYYFYEGDHWHVCLTSSCAPHKVQNDQIRGL